MVLLTSQSPLLPFQFLVKILDAREMPFVAEIAAVTPNSSAAPSRPDHVFGRVGLMTSGHGKRQKQRSPPRNPRYPHAARATRAAERKPRCGKQTPDHAIQESAVAAGPEGTERLQRQRHPMQDLGNVERQEPAVTRHKKAQAARRDALRQADQGRQLHHCNFLTSGTALQNFIEESGCLVCAAM